MEDEYGIRRFISFFVQEGLDYVHDGNEIPVDEHTLDYVERKIASTRVLLADKIRLNKILERQRIENERVDLVSNERRMAKKQGYIYLAKDVVRGFIKIGYSTDVETRMKQLKTSNAGVEYFKHYKGEMSDEQKLHGYFKKTGKRVSGEWFSLGSSDLQHIEEYFSTPEYD